MSLCNTDVFAEVRCCILLCNFRDIILVWRQWSQRLVGDVWCIHYTNVVIAWVDSSL